jgi:dynein heavy chain 1
VRIVFEVQDLKYATLATVSRCGMVWFSEETLSTGMILENYLLRLRNEPLEEGERDTYVRQEPPRHPGVILQRDCAAANAPNLQPGSFVFKALKLAEGHAHVMDLTRLRAMGAMFSLLNKGIITLLEYNSSHPGRLPSHCSCCSSHRCCHRLPHCRVEAAQVHRQPSGVRSAVGLWRLAEHQRA